jgi:hypothetical protein
VSDGEPIAVDGHVSVTKVLGTTLWVHPID